MGDKTLEIRDSADNWSIEIPDEGDVATVVVNSTLDRQGLLYLANAVHFAVGRLPIPTTPDGIPQPF